MTTRGVLSAIMRVAILFSVATAVEAAAPSNVLWSTLPLCYKHTGPAVVGYAIPKVMTCNSGKNFTPSGVPIPVPDCGPGGKGCVVPLGCLNLVCAKTPNAIWNPLTKTCGCG